MKNRIQHTTEESKQWPISKVRVPFKITRWTALIAVLVLLICAGASALVLQQDEKQNSTAPTSEMTSPASQTSNGEPLNSSSQTTQPASTQSSSNSKPSASSQSQSDCKREEIPYKTTYQNVTYLKKGQTQESGGYNGFMSYCGSEEPFVAKPVDKIVYVGTAPTDEEIEQQRIAAQVELEAKQMQWNRDYASAYQSCLSSLPNNYPSKESFCAGQASQQVGPYPR